MLHKKLLQTIQENSIQQHTVRTFHHLIHQLFVLLILLILWMGPIYVGPQIAWQFHELAWTYIYLLGIGTLTYCLHLIFYWKGHRSKS